MTFFSALGFLSRPATTMPDHGTYINPAVLSNDYCNQNVENELPSEQAVVNDNSRGQPADLVLVEAAHGDSEPQFEDAVLPEVVHANSQHQSEDLVFGQIDFHGAPALDLKSNAALPTIEETGTALADLGEGDGSETQESEDDFDDDDNSAVDRKMPDFSQEVHEMQSNKTYPGEDKSSNDDDTPLIDLFQNKVSPESSSSNGSCPAIEHEQSAIPEHDHSAESGNTAGDLQNAASGETKFDWKLPDFEIKFEQAMGGYPMAIISIPGLVREPLYLSIDYPEDEYCLFEELFLETQKSARDPEPKLAILNFHTVAGLVLDAINLHEHGTKADGDELFLQVLDNWRIGMQYGRESYKLIRELRELFDLGMDIIAFLNKKGLVPKLKKGKSTKDEKAVNTPKVVKKPKAGGKKLGRPKGSKNKVVKTGRVTKNSKASKK
ncbi:hypothetical protein K469DRAFT_696038 [Zopfia rhizophila CBS 207.26]|uniref:Uncharacterized protein n=1 Tax=Zopfia rhizophila CBS 207.26 TaxID=1314779 RepID=A0A6A6EIQ5_9PEZI|nr:hypothetical protein K469DRAFT_696038 [Zopfia rhizophila CBS 207.26]